MPVERDLVTLIARDGVANDALLHTDRRAARLRARATGRRTAVMHVHGVMGNFLVGTLRDLPAPLARAGFPTLVLDTRMGDVGQLFGQAIFDEATRDLDAGFSRLREQGFTDVVISGYSSGAALATRWAATRRPPGMRGLVGLATPWGLPQSLEARWGRWGAEPSYAEVTERARRAIGADHPDRAENDRIFVVERSSGPTREPRDGEVYTYRTWWHSRGPEATPAMPWRQIGGVPAPILLVQGTEDAMVNPAEAEALAGVARQGGNPDVQVASVAGGDHAFADRELLMTRAVVGWLRRVA